MPDTPAERQVVSFDSIRLKVGDTLQMQAVGTAETTHYGVRYMGAVKDASVLFTLPIIDHEGMWMRLNGEYVFRTLTGSHIYAFVARLLKPRAHPYPYAHFSYPESVEARRVRRSPRIKLQLASEAEKADATTVAITFLDLSLHGALVEADGPLGAAGETVRVTLPVHLSEVNRKLTLEADIRNVFEGERPRYGLEFHRLDDDDVLLLHFFIDYQIAEGGSSGG
ncbi:MAG: flagellar brake protein [Hydrogenophilaceae bacterium]